MTEQPWFRMLCLAVGCALGFIMLQLNCKTAADWFTHFLKI